MSEKFFDKIYNGCPVIASEICPTMRYSHHLTSPIRCWICSPRVVSKPDTTFFWTLPAKVVCFLEKSPSG